MVIFAVIHHLLSVEVSLDWDDTKCEIVRLTGSINVQDAEAIAVGRLWQRYERDILIYLAKHWAAGWLYRFSYLKTNVEGLTLVTSKD